MSRMPRTWFALVLMAWSCVYPTHLLCRGGDETNAAPGIRYTVSLAGYQDHILRVQLELAGGEASRQVQLPVWNALYQVRDFSQYVNWVRAKGSSGDALTVRKLDKTTWQIEGAQDGAVVEYEIVADQPGPYGAQVNATHAFFNLAEILMYCPENRSSTARLTFVNTPAGWRFATALPIAAGGFQAASYDQLVDSPVEAGTFQESDFDEAGGHYRVVVDADRSDYNMEKIVADVQRIVAAATSWMDDRPFQSYLFLYHFPRGPGGGGMEHAYSTAIDLSAQGLQDNPHALDDVTAHEFFHLWNVKRIRPQSLEPIDYTKENYTRALWFSEGVTSTVEDIILLRAGLLDERRRLQRLGAEISELEQRPAHLTQSAEESSLDAWLERDAYYRQPERSISYYNKGELLGLALDLKVREASQGAASLRDVFQWMNQNFARQGKFFPDSAGVRAAAEAVCHQDLSAFFEKYVAGVEEIPWDDFFTTVGLRVIRRASTLADPGFAAARNFDASPFVLRMRPGSEAAKAGLAAGDVLLQINGRVAASDFERKLEELRPGDMLRVRVRHAGAEHEIQWRIGSREEVEFELKDVDNVTTQQKARRAAWLRGESQLAGDERP
ncbi:MAG: PDZ domain-containing protein [Terriglobales bacterium]